MMTADQRDAFTEILCGAREEFSQAFQQDSDHSEACSEQMENLSFAAELAELKGLDLICGEISRNVTDFTDKNQLQILMEWSDHLLAFIRDPENGQLAQNLVQYVPEESRNDCIQSLLPVATEVSATNDNPQVQLVNELEPLRVKLGKIIDQIFGATFDSALEVLKERYTDTVHCLQETAKLLNLHGVVELCDHVLVNLNFIDFKWISTNRSQGYLVFQQWPGLMLTYLSDPTNDENCLALINHFELQGWPHPLDDTGARNVLESLLSSGFMESYFGQSQARFDAQPGDMDMPALSDLNPDLFDAFLHDTPNQSAQLCDCVGALKGNQADLPQIQQAQRITHTIKGAANVTGINAVANMAHVLEDIFEQLCKPPFECNDELLALLQSSVDCLAAMVDFLQGTDELPQERHDVYQRLVAHQNKSVLPQASNDAQIDSLNNGQALNDAPLNDSDLPEDNNTEPVSQQVETVRVPLHVISSLFQLAEEITIALGSSQEQTQRILKQLDEVQQQDTRVQEQRFELENVVDVRGVARRQRKLDTKNDAEFDSLEMDQYDEIYDVAHSLIESVADARELNQGVSEQIKNLDALLLQQTRLNKDLQRLIKHTRMIAVQSVVPRLQRCIRHAARVTGKLIDFQVEGVETEINEEILDKLIDPIMHLLRNAVDHGIEEAQQRVAINKPAEGRVQLRFGQDGQNITIWCDDDGRGIDEEKIRTKAIESGLLKENDVVTSQQIKQLMLTSGFSTKDSANQVSGRGIGMDAVHKRIRELGGQLRIVSLETGSRFEIQVPLQLVATNALLVQIQSQWFAIPTRQLDQILAPGSAQPTQLGDRDALSHEDTHYLTHSLGEMLGMPEEIENNRPILLTDVGTEPAAVYVDAVIANQDLVIKSTGEYVKNVPGVAGVSILGDGRLVPVLDLAVLLERKQLPQWHNEQTVEEIAYYQGENTVLIVDDSLSVRKSLTQLVGDAGYRSSSARDGLEAWEKIQESPPAVILVDMEMPRMNGIELTSRIRSSEATKSIPVVMITSRSMQKHRDAAEKSGVSQYFTKPFSETELLTEIHRYVQESGS